MSHAQTLNKQATQPNEPVSNFANYSNPLSVICWYLIGDCNLIFLHKFRLYFIFSHIYFGTSPCASSLYSDEISNSIPMEECATLCDYLPVMCLPETVPTLLR